MRHDITVKEMSDLLRDFGFESRLIDGKPYRVFDHPGGAQIAIPDGDDTVLSISTVAGCRFMLDQWGLMERDEFDQRFGSKKVG